MKNHYNFKRDDKNAYDDTTEQNFLTGFDNYEEVRELFKAVLTIKEMAVVYLVHCRFSYAKIAKTLKISEDYCRKLYNRAENKLKEALGIGM